MATLLIVLFSVGFGVCLGVLFSDKLKVKVESVESEVKKDA